MMKRHILLLLVVIAALFATTTGQRRRLRIRTENLEKEVTVLKSDVAELKKYVAHLNYTLNTACLCKNNTNHTTTNITMGTNKTISESNKTEPNSTFQILKISRINIGGGKVNYTVTYAVNHNVSLPNLFSYWNRQNKDYYHTSLNGSNPKPSVLGAANTTASVVTNAENHTSVLFVFGVAEVWYALRLNNSNSQNITMTNISTPELYVMPKEVVYPIGENASIQIMTSNNTHHKVEFSLSDFVLTKLGTEEFVDFDYKRFSQAYFVSQNDTRSKLYVANVTSFTAREPLSGVLTMNTVTRYPNSSILDNVSTYRRFVIRPFNQSGPFLKNLFVYYTQYMPKDDDGHFYTTCKTDSPCTLACPTVVGSNKTRLGVTWHKKEKDGTVTKTTKLTTQESPFYITDYSAPIPKGVDEAVCEAHTMHGPRRKIVQGIKIVWTYPPSIGYSRVREIGDGGRYKTLRVICSATGTPVPSMAIRVECSAGTILLSGDELETISESENFIRVSQDVLLVRQYFEQTLYVSCIAWNSAGEATKKFRPLNMR